MQRMNVDEQSASGQPIPAELVIQRAGETDWERVKAVRLAALEESPGAFGSTLAKEREYADTAWRQWCRDTATFLALQDGIPIGMAAGVDGTSHEERKLIAMWLHPAHRGSGAAAALLTAIGNWAQDDGAATLMLWVTRGNDLAAGLYRRAGFTETGASKPLPSNPSVIEDQLSLDLS
jgi:GNAT superfamily N-acetyltransferase